MTAIFTLGFRRPKHYQVIELIIETMNQENEIDRLRTRSALLESLLAESLHYVDKADCSPRWLAEAERAVSHETDPDAVWQDESQLSLFETNQS